MRQRKEFKLFIVVTLAVVAALVVVAYVPTFWTPGDDTPLEHEMSGEPPAKFREP